MKRFIKILSILLIISISLVVLESSVFATDLEDLLNGGTGNEILDIEEITTQAGNNTVTNNTTNNSITNNTVTNNSVANNVTNTGAANEILPQTGITGNVTMVLFIIVCGIASVYAYKKVKKYNI